MVQANLKLATALEALHALQAADRHAIRSGELGRAQRELLLRQGFLQEVMKGWYIAAEPGARAGESTAWYAGFWRFCRDYLSARFDGAWVLTPEQSLRLHAGDTSVPAQIVVRAPRGRNQVTRFIHDTSMFEIRQPLPPAEDMIKDDGLRLYRSDAALVAAGPAFFTQNPVEARTVLANQRDASGVLVRLLRDGRSTVAGRLAGAFRNIGRDREAEAIIEAMRAAGFQVRVTDPFESRLEGVLRREPSPYVQRIRLLWEAMRDDVVARFPAPPARPNDLESYMRDVEDAYVTDAYHSLSIEGYRVSSELIERVRRGAWSPDEHDRDRDQRDALAARGYWQAFQAVKASVRRVLRNENAGLVADEDSPAWYRELFAPSVAAGLVKPEALAGHRDGPVFIRGSRHVPLNADAVRDAIPALFDLLRGEPHPGVRAVLGHFIFVYIHPYYDGNGRTGRFLMNVMLASGGYPWTVVPIQQRGAYMAALEAASVGRDIGPLATLLAELLLAPRPPAV